MSNDSGNEREVALVTGASAGIGTEMAWDLAERGFDLILTARRVDRLDDLKQKIEAKGQVRVQVVPEDLAAPDGADSLIRKVEALGRPISFLANNAGFGVHGGFVDHERGKLDEMVRLNLLVLTTLTYHFGRAMRARGRGRILQVSSVAAFQPSPYYSAYAATKAYVLFLSEALSYELSGSGVTSCGSKAAAL